MSHTSTVKGIKIMDVNALRGAVNELSKQGIKIEMIPNAKPRAFYNDQQGMGQADFVLKLGDAAYDVGLYKQPDGSYEPRTDLWGGSVQKVLGATPSKPELREQAALGKLLQMYGVVAATEKARKQGYSVQRKTAVDGTVQLVVTGFA